MNLEELKQKLVLDSKQYSKSMKSTINQIEDLDKETKEVQKTTDKSFKKMAKSVKGFSKSIISTKTAVLGLGVAAAGVGTALIGMKIIKDVADDIIDLGDEIHKFSILSKMSTEDISKWKHAAELSGIEFGVLKQSVIKLGTASDSVFSNFGIDPNQFKILSVNDQLMTLAGTMKSMSQMEQLDLAVKVFGVRGASMLPLLKENVKVLEDLKTQAGLVFTSADVKAAADFNDAMLNLTRSWQGLVLTGLTPVLHTITPLIAELKTYMADNKEAIDQTIKGWAVDIEGYLKGVNWEQTGKDITEVATALLNVGKGLAWVIKEAIKGAGLLKNMNKTQQKLVASKTKVAETKLVADTIMTYGVNTDQLEADIKIVKNNNLALWDWMRSKEQIEARKRLKTAGFLSYGSLISDKTIDKTVKSFKAGVKKIYTIPTENVEAYKKATRKIVKDIIAGKQSFDNAVLPKEPEGIPERVQKELKWELDYAKTAQKIIDIKRVKTVETPFYESFGYSDLYKSESSKFKPVDYRPVKQPEAKKPLVEPLIVKPVDSTLTSTLDKQYDTLKAIQEKSQAELNSIMLDGIQEIELERAIVLNNRIKLTENGLGTIKELYKKNSEELNAVWVDQAISHQQILSSTIDPVQVVEQKVFGADPDYGFKLNIPTEEELARQRENAGLIDKIKLKYQETKDEAANFSDTWSDTTSAMTESISWNMESFFSSLTDGTDNLGEKFKATAKSIFDDFSRMIAKMIAKALLFKAISGLGGFFGSAPNVAPIMSPGFSAMPDNFGALPGVSKFADGGIVSKPTFSLIGEGKYNEAVVPMLDNKSVFVDMLSGNIPLPSGQKIPVDFGNITKQDLPEMPELTPFATGGVVNKPTPALIGEGQYNEAVVPLPDGRSIPVDFTGRSDNTTNNNRDISIVNNINIKSTGSDEEAQRQGDLISNQIRETLLEERRPGGILSEAF